MTKTVLVQKHKDGTVDVYESTFGTYRDSYLWNWAWVREHYDRKSIGPEGRTWYGVVTRQGIQQVQELGWRIVPAKVELIKEPTDG